MVDFGCMKTYSLDEAQAIVSSKIKESVITLGRELRMGKKSSLKLILKAKAPKEYVSRPV